jgi:hypothetical protein
MARIASRYAPRPFGLHLVHLPFPTMQGVPPRALSMDLETCLVIYG